MNIAVLLKQVPDLVEELGVDESGRGLDRSWLRFVLNEFDAHALEQALLLKEQVGGTVVVFALNRGEVDETLFSALAKGADSAVKITGDFDDGLDSHTAGRIFQSILGSTPYDLILTGVQTNDDVDGQVGGILAGYLHLPYVSVVSGLCISEDHKVATVRKEFPGGLLSEIAIRMPAVIGIQAASQPPRYVPIARLRQIMKTGHIKEVAADIARVNKESPGFQIRRMFKPEVTGRAEIISGSQDVIANRIIGILAEKGIVR